MKAWEQRRKQHDEVAVPLVLDKFRSYGFNGHIIGTESDEKETRRALQGKRDIVSLMWRFRPDRLLTGDNHKSLACEIKSESGSSENFAIEFDSWMVARSWDNLQEGVMYAFVDLSPGDDPSVKCCWAKQVPRPVSCLIPMRPDWKETMDNIQVNYPTIRLIPIEHNSGSGTAFFTIRKVALYLKNFDDFMASELGLILPGKQEIKKPQPVQLVLFS